MSWMIGSLRLTAFPDPAAPLATSLTWQQLTAILSPAIEHAERGVHRQEGPFAKGKLVLRTQWPLRVDLMYRPLTGRHGGNANALPAIGPRSAALTAFAPIVESLWPIVPPIQRLVFSAHFLESAADVPKAHQLVAAHIRTVQFYLDGASDFVYQISRPRASLVVPGMSIDRLGRWSVAQAHRTVIDARTARVGRQPLRLAAVLATDVSADAGAQRLPSESLALLYKELVRLSLEISDEGDIR